MRHVALWSEKDLDSNRTGWIDIARGIGIWLIAAGHLLRRGHIADYILSGAVALFFYLAGYVYYWHEDRAQYWKGRVLRLVVPYLAVGSVSIILYEFLGAYAAHVLGTAAPPGFAADFRHLLFANGKLGCMKWNESLWFLPCLFSMTVLAEFIEYMVRTSTTGIIKAAEVRIVYVVLFGGIGYILTQWMKGGMYPWHIETALCMLFFFEAGQVRRQIHDSRVRWAQLSGGKFRKPRVDVRVMSGICGIAASLILTIYNGSISVRTDEYPHYLLSFFIMFLFSEGVVQLTIAAEHCAFLENIGRASMDILLWNKFPVLFVQLAVGPILFHWERLFLEKDTVPAAVLTALLALPCMGLCIAWTKMYQAAAQSIGRRLKKEKTVAENE